MNKLVLIFSCFSLSISAFCQANSIPVTIHGFVAQGVNKAAQSSFVTDYGESSFELTELGINLSSRLNEKFRIAAQVVYLDGGNRYSKGLRLDYLLLDWSIINQPDWQLNAILGRYKNQHWLYSATRDVPHTRPSILLPQSIYYDAFRDIALGSDGIAINYSRNAEAADVDIFWSLGRSGVNDESAKLILGKSALGDVEQKYVHQLSAYFRPKLSQWQFGVSLLDSDFSYKASANDNFVNAEATTERIMLSAVYFGDRWQLSSELLQEKFTFNGFFHPLARRSNIGQGLYLLGRYFYTDQLIAVAGYDKFDINKDDRNGKKLERDSGGQIPSHFGYMNDSMIGLHYRFSRYVEVRGEYHWFEGAGRLSAPLVPNAQLNKSKYWSMWAIQLMYWF